MGSAPALGKKGGSRLLRIQKLTILILSYEKVNYENRNLFETYLSLYIKMCCGAGAGGPEIFWGPGAGAEIFFLIHMFCSQFGGS